MIAKHNRITCLLAAFLLAPCALADDEPHESEEADHDHHCAHPDYAIALIGVYAAGFPAGEDVVHHGGGGLSFHTGLVPDELELEIAVKALFAGEGHTHFPLEVMLKIPVHLADSLFLSFGLGPVVALNQHDGHVEMSFGGGFGLELSYWYNSWGGIVIGAAYEFLFHDGVTNKLVTIAGPAFGW